MLRGSLLPGGAKRTQVAPVERDNEIIAMGTNVGETAREIRASHGVEVLTVPDEETLAAMRLLWQRMKLLVEPSSAIVFAALLRNRERFAGRRVGLLLSGGNVDLDALMPA